MPSTPGTSSTKIPTNGPEGLRLLADWFDLRDAENGSSGDQVQQDLRHWADDMEAASAALDLLDGTYRAVERALPETFYADRTPDERVAIMVDHWQRAIRVINELSPDVDDDESPLERPAPRQLPQLYGTEQGERTP